MVDEVAAYQTISVVGEDEQGWEVLRLLQNQQLDMLTFTSSSTVRNFMQWLRDCTLSGADPPENIVTHNPHLKINLGMVSLEQFDHERGLSQGQPTASCSNYYS